MEFLKHLVIFSMLATAGIPDAKTYIPETQTIEAEPLQAEVIIEPLQAESIEEEKKPIKNDQAEEDTDSDSCVIDDEKVESCDHAYTRIHGTGGEEGDVWEYICDLCGDTYFESYDEPDETMLEIIDEDPDNTEPAGENTNDETEE